jgi:tetratricopeptide (TPR) repeat protein
LPMTWLFADAPERSDFTIRARLSPADLADTRQEIDRSLRDFLRELDRPIKVISGEGISLLAESEVDRLREYLKMNFPFPVKVIIYIRNYYEFLDSSIQESVKNGAVLRGLEASICAGHFEGPNYQNRIQKFQKSFGANNVIVKVFDPDLFQDNSVIADFCETIGVPQLYSVLPVIRANVSVSTEAVRLMSRYNERYPVRKENAYNSLRSEKLPKYLALPKGKKFRITDGGIRAAYDRVIANDKAFVRTILPENLANIVVAQKERPADVTTTDAVDDVAAEIIGLILGDLESHESALRIVAAILPARVSDSDGVQHVIRHAPSIRDEVICRALAVVCADSAKPQCAAALAHRAVELGPNQAENHVLAGDIACLRQDWSAAEMAYRQAIARDPKNAPAHTRLWTCLRSLGRDDEALVVARKTLELSSPPDDVRQDAAD